MVKMKLLKSKLGWILVVIYLVLSAISIIYSRICNVGICDVGYLLIPAIPWIGLIGDGSYELFAYVISIILNIIVIYLIGYLISYLLKINLLRKGFQKLRKLSKL